MNNAVTKIALLLIIICSSYVGFEANACVCSPQRSPYGEYQNARAVFVGKVVDSKDVTVGENRTYTVPNEFSISLLVNP